MKKSHRGLKVTFLLLGLLPVILAAVAAIVLGFVSPDLILPTGFNLFTDIMLPILINMWGIIFEDLAMTLSSVFGILAFGLLALGALGVLLYIIFAFVKKQPHFIFSMLGFAIVCVAADVFVFWFIYAASDPYAFLPASGDVLFIMILMITALAGVLFYFIFVILDLIFSSKVAPLTTTASIDENEELMVEEPVFVEEPEPAPEPEPVVEEKPVEINNSSAPKKEKTEEKPVAKKPAKKASTQDGKAKSSAKAEPKKEESKAEPKKAEAKKEVKPAASKGNKAAPKKEEKPVAKKPEPTPAPKKEEKVSNGKTYHISHRPDGKWQVKAGGAEKALKLFNTQKEAIEYAKQFGSYRIHSMSGKIRKG